SGREEIAEDLDPPEGRSRREPQEVAPPRRRQFHLVPSQRDGDGRHRHGPQRIGDDRRLAGVVLAPVDEHFPSSQRTVHTVDEPLRVPVDEQTGNGPGERLRLGEGVVGIDGDVDVQALRPRGLDHRDEAEVVEHGTHVQRRAARLDDAGGRPGVEVEHDHVRRQRVAVVGHPPHVRVQLQRGKVRGPHQRRQVVDDGEQRLYRVYIEPREAVATVGGGDAFLAGYIAARYGDESPAECLRFGVACGAESVQRLGAGLIDPQKVERLVGEVDVRRLVAPAEVG
ncbi:MAG: hypothetical protein KY463_07335, partial [Actinobacteria bacterium]|nr:hypothetical protein [Actinomycetota bacterium]